ncbi:MAG: efflux RND transporter periplasmic adaptor subunit, partial [Rubripirellula sp.]
LRKLELRRAELQLLRRQVVAPAGGVISEVFHEPGEYITPGDPAIVRLLVMDKMFAVVNVPVEETNLFQVGSPARVYLRSTEKTIDANISSIAPDIDGESGTVQVRIELDNSEGTLLSGDRCTLHLLHHAKPNRKTAQRLTREPAVTIEHIGRRINR